MVICFVIKLGLSIAASFLTTQKSVPYAFLSIFLVEYFLLVLIYLIIYYKRWERPVRSNLDLIWSITTCFIMTIATSTSLALYYYSIIDRTTCLLVCGIIDILFTILSSIADTCSGKPYTDAQADWVHNSQADVAHFGKEWIQKK